MAEAQTISSLVTGGKASAGPPLGPALGPMGVNIMEVIKAINEKTKDFEGMKVPVTVTVYPDTKKMGSRSWNSVSSCSCAKRGWNPKRFWNFWN